jgi:hypothetical protein
MAIQLMAAMVVHSTFDAPEGKHLVGPMTPISLPQQYKAEFQRAGKFTFKLPDIELVHILWGGREGESYNTLAALTYPSGAAVSSQVGHFTWGKDSATTFTVKMEDVLIGFDQPGIYHFKLSINGEGVSDLPLPVFWQGEFPD